MNKEFELYWNRVRHKVWCIRHPKQEEDVEVDVKSIAFNAWKAGIKTVDSGYVDQL